MLWLWAGDYVRLAVMWPNYRSTIQTEPGSRVAFEWETLELMFGQVARTLIYDPSDSEAYKNDIPYNDYDGSFLRGSFRFVDQRLRKCGIRQLDVPNNVFAFLYQSPNPERKTSICSSNSGR